MNWLGRLDVILLALMLACVVANVIRFWNLYRDVRWKEENGIPDLAFHRNRRKVIVALDLKISFLKSIASTAPFLGLVGTCFGILSAFGGIGMEKHAVVIKITSGIAAALVTTAAGIAVAIPWLK